ncbi:DUF3443 family protein [Trinickia violacea]|uniref:DUF3443 family protein n=1 Tax=Trinickia violacea TaxID=2571746 RepID=A0A4P8II13_9BURK|nr:DUF3443 family protein [Trinickia violacea]QCP47776.1 DUF3443 family protein [Trinickia violacea]
MRFTTRLIQGLGVLGFAAAISLFAGCGGGGGGGGSSSSSGSSSSGSNSAAVTVNNGVSGFPNIPTVSVTVCAPGSTTNCQTINNVQVDTESFGLRVVSGAVSQVLGSLPQTTINGSGLVECTVFADNTHTLGSVRTANVQIAGETASNLPIQIIGDQSSSLSPLGCGGTGENTAQDLGANGILGIGVASIDCPACVNAAVSPAYYTCSGSTCTPTAVPAAQQVTNPVTQFATDNNGVILTLPAVSSGGNSSASGTLVFGIGTQSNNANTASNKFTTSAFGDVNGTLNGSTVSQAFFDSGSNAYFIDSSLAPSPLNSSTSLCTGSAKGFYCPPSTVSVPITVQSISGTGSVSSLSLSVANANSLFSSNNFAYNNLGGPLSGKLDIGLPFFYGRSVFYGYASGSQSPYVAL